MARVQNVMHHAEELEELEPFEFCNDFKGEIDDGSAIPKPGQVIAKQRAGATKKHMVQAASIAPIAPHASKEAWGAKAKRKSVAGQNAAPVPGISASAAHAPAPASAISSTPSVKTNPGGLITIVETSPVLGNRNSRRGSQSDGDPEDSPASRAVEPVPVTELKPLKRVPSVGAVPKQKKRQPEQSILPEAPSLADLIAQGERNEEARRAAVEEAQRRARERVAANKPVVHVPTSPRSAAHAAREEEAKEAARKAAAARIAAAAAKKREEEEAAAARAAELARAKAEAADEEARRLEAQALAAKARVAEKKARMLCDCCA